MTTPAIAPPPPTMLLPALFVLAYMLDEQLSFDHTLVYFEATPDEDEADNRAYAAGHQSGLLERVQREYPTAAFVNDYVIVGPLVTRLMNPRDA